MEAHLLGKIDITAAGRGKGLLGDINGDGRMEVVFVQADGDIDDRYVPHMVTCVTAYDLNGNILWQIFQESPEQLIGFRVCFKVERGGLLQRVNAGVGPSGALHRNSVAVQA